MRNLILLFALMFFVASCGTMPDAPKDVVPEPPVVTPEPVKTEPASYKFNWDNQKWTNVMIENMRQLGWDKLKTEDMSDFGYREGNDLLKFWGNLVVEIAKWESSYIADKVYKEPFRDSSGARVLSTGLFQISKESANNRNRGDCKIKDDAQLKDPEFNIWCSLRIMDFFIRESNLIRGVNPNRGLARYWSVVRGTSGSYTKNALAAIKKANE